MIFTVHKSSGNGFTLIEIIIVTALFTTLGTLVSLVGLQDLHFSTVKSERNLAMSVLQRARRAALTNQCDGSNCVTGQSHGVHVDTLNRQYILFSGEFDPISPANEYIAFNDGQMSHTGMTQVLFNRFDATATLTGGDLSLDNGAAVVSVNPEGQIDWTH